MHGKIGSRGLALFSITPPTQFIKLSVDTLVDGVRADGNVILGVRVPAILVALQEPGPAIGMLGLAALIGT